MRALGPGAMVAGYRIERRIGAGGMGSVYLAQHPRLPRKDALKILTRGADAEFRARFLREAELAGRLDHPNVVSIYDCGSDGEMLWIAMQFVAGCDAGELVKQHSGGLPADRAVAIAGGAARGLDAAHRAGLLHRDVKPANILIEPGVSGQDRVLVTDFGIARATTETIALTAAGKVLATLAFAAPEQISGDRLDERTDVYALGGTLYQLLTGAVPFPRETAAAVMHAHLTAPRPRPSAIAAVPRGLDVVVARAMATNPADRYRSCGELVAAANAALHEQLPPLRPRRRLLVGIIAAVAVTALTATTWIAARERPASTAPPTGAPSTSQPAAAWGTFGVVADTFRELLPATPSSRGYQGIRCTPTDIGNTPVALDVALDQPRLTCSGAGTTLWATCNTNRSAMPAAAITGETQGNETWSRPSGTGRATWLTFDSDGRPRGQMDLQFDGARAFCKLRVAGANSGRELFEQWLPTAPI